MKRLTVINIVTSKDGLHCGTAVTRPCPKESIYGDRCTAFHKRLVPNHEIGLNKRLKVCIDRESWIP